LLICFKKAGKYNKIRHPPKAVTKKLHSPDNRVFILNHSPFRDNDFVIELEEGKYFRTPPRASAIPVQWGTRHRLSHQKQNSGFSRISSRLLLLLQNTFW